MPSAVNFDLSREANRLSVLKVNVTGRHSRHSEKFCGLYPSSSATEVTGSGTTGIGEYVASTAEIYLK
jgi:hypothetical protein